MAASRILVRLIGLVSTLILARLLTPGDFGIVALASALYFVIQTVSDLRFEQALISLRDKSDADFDTAWTMNALRGVASATILLAAAYPYAQLMDDPRLAGVLAVLAGVPLIHGLKNPHFLRFEIAMDFRKEFALQIVAKEGRASTSFLQRKLRIGYNSAARLIERMEQDGHVSAPDHVGRRKVLMGGGDEDGPSGVDAPW